MRLILVQGILSRLLRRLRSESILTADLGLPDDADDLEAKYMGICRRSPEDKMRRIGRLLAYWDNISY